MKRVLLTLALTCTAATAQAEVTLEPGAFFVIAREYHHETNTFTDGPPEGEGEGCFQITGVKENEIEFVLATGTHTPWWSDGEVFQPGFRNAYVNFRDSSFAQNNPQADWRELLHQMLKTVPSCPAPGS